MTAKLTGGTPPAVETVSAEDTGATEEPRSGFAWWVWLLAPLLCLPCLLGGVGGVAAVIVGVGAAAAALTHNVVLSLLVAGLVLAAGVGAAAVYLRRRAALACGAGECAPARVPRVASTKR